MQVYDGNTLLLSENGKRESTKMKKKVEQNTNTKNN